ncbi:hypothetical protein AnigIFM63309_004309 [Aspergillus niger]|nr:hypothetical protein AnigIFM50267_000526 [Aspergillus niger]GLA37396.1 hypothetical protein AnigIFM63309_004309 [Aspergillus niger]
MSLKLCCFRGWGTNVQILQAQLGGLMAELRRDNTATFHFEEGNVDSAPGPRIAGYYDDPYYSCYRFSLPLSAPESGDRMSLLNAYAWLYDVIADAAAFDGILASPMGAFWRPDF